MRQGRVQVGGWMARSARRAVVWVLWVAGGLGVLASCASDPTQGYTMGTAFDSSIQTVHIPMFGNSTFTRGVEVELTDAVIKQVQSTTPWRVVPADSAQTTLTGTVTRSDLRTLSINRDSGLVQEVAVVLSVDFTWKDNRTGQIVVRRENFQAAEPFVPATGVQERIEHGRHATIQELARDIVASMRSKW